MENEASSSMTSTGACRKVSAPAERSLHRTEQRQGPRVVRRCCVNRSGDAAEPEGRTSDGCGEFGERCGEEPPCRCSVPPGRDEHVDDLSMLVDRGVHVPPFAADFDACFVDEPPVTWCVPAEPGRVREQRRETLYGSVALSVALVRHA